MSHPDGITYHDKGSVMASLHPQNSPQGALSMNLVVLVDKLLHRGENFIIRVDIFESILGVQQEDSLCSFSPDFHQSRCKEVSL
jgi:hypothetical protein